jgi:hypothetical protein
LADFQPSLLFEKLRRKNMKQTKNFLRGVLALALLGGMVFMTPAALQAKSKRDITVHVTVTVHNSDIGVSAETLDEMVDELLEASDIVVSETGGSSVTELEIDIYRDDNGFRATADWDDDDEVEAEKRCETQDAIDDIVKEEVEIFIEFILKD